jgi:hypothetical protein
MLTSMRQIRADELQRMVFIDEVDAVRNVPVIIRSRAGELADGPRVELDGPLLLFLLQKH